MFIDLSIAVKPTSFGICYLQYKRELEYIFPRVEEICVITKHNTVNYCYCQSYIIYIDQEQQSGNKFRDVAIILLEKGVNFFKNVGYHGFLTEKNLSESRTS